MVLRGIRYKGFPQPALIYANQRPQWKHQHSFVIDYNRNEGLLMWCSGKEPTCQCRRCRRCEFNPWAGKIPWRRAWQPTLENPMDRGAWQAIVHRVTKSQTQLKLLSARTHTCTHTHTYRYLFYNHLLNWQQVFHTVFNTDDYLS